MKKFTSFVDLLLLIGYKVFVLISIKYTTVSVLKPGKKTQTIESFRPMDLLSVCNKQPER